MEGRERWNEGLGSGQAAWMAGRLLEAIQRGDLADLKTGLSEAERCARRRLEEPAAAERLELLAAVAARLRCSMARFERRLTPRPQGLTVYVRLLHHLARSPRSAGPAPGTSSS